MSVAKAQIQEDREKKSKRGSVKNSTRLDAFASRSKSHSAEWASCDPKRVACVVEHITALGGAVTFGLSRDQGAHSLTLMLDGERETLWFNGGADLDEELDLVIGKLEAMN